MELIPLKLVHEFDADNYSPCIVELLEPVPLALPFAKLRMERTLHADIALVIYRGEDGSVPFVGWFEKLPHHPQDEVVVRWNAFRNSASRHPERGHQPRSVQRHHRPPKLGTARG